MDDILMNVNWIAVLVGTVAAFVLGMFWFGQLFGKTWSAGSHNIQPPKTPPMLAMGLQLLGTFLLAWVIGATATINALGTAVFILLALAILQTSGGMFSQKSTTAALIDGSYILASGVLMILAQAIF